MGKHDGRLLYCLSIFFALSLQRLSASSRPQPSPMKKLPPAPSSADPPRHPKRFAGKTFIVTGGTSGVGKTISLQLAREGAAAVTIVGRSEARGAAVVEQVGVPWRVVGPLPPFLGLAQQSTNPHTYTHTYTHTHTHTHI